MIKFKQCTWQNFFSYGNNVSSVNLDTGKITFIKGKNGAGKSVLLCAVTFALYGTPFRSVTKTQIVNSVNKNNCVVTISFEIGDTLYKIERGVSPNKLDVYINGELINSDHAVRKTQEWIEKSVLQMDKKTFVQTCIIGNASFKPFMQLTPGDRRAVVEDILGFTEIGKYLQVFRKEVSKRKTDKMDIFNKLSVLKGQIDVLTDNVAVHVASSSNSNETKIVDRIDGLKEQRKSLAPKTEKRQVMYGKAVSEKSVLFSKLDKIEHKAKSLLSKIDSLGQKKCPTCNQDLPKKDATKQIAELKAQYIKEMQHGKETLKFANEQALLAEKYSDANTMAADLSILDQDLRMLENELATAKKINTNAVDATKKKIAKLKTQIKIGDIAYDSVSKKLATSQLLKKVFEDSGVKSKLINDFVPVLNSLIQKYLKIFGLNVVFVLDNTFKENIISANHDTYSYASFSEGEKKRIDLACLFAWREMAKMKNSSTTNLLILDEIFDSALDEGGIYDAKEIIKDEVLQRGASVFVITHSEIVSGMSTEVLTAVKKGQFSQLT